ncbi:hypothetical protein EVAR_61753_1 [Eumeta japonica]|uniref:Uncharacterized protein n=1 Tax=Eumeta variegata TaxID=151549 RepID=A0A4C1ZA93_EUMVA|nr:hypothetical protein EVAR_61753_1 [Eumeta japonica]
MTAGTDGFMYSPRCGDWQAARYFNIDSFDVTAAVRSEMEPSRGVFLVSRGISRRTQTRPGNKAHRRAMITGFYGRDGLKMVHIMDESRRALFAFAAARSPRPLSM